MHGDFSLNPQAYRDHVSRVLYQQGRVQLDSDFNEHTESLLRAMRGAASDIIGPHGGVGDSFEILPPGIASSDFMIRWGEYYVDGIRCVNRPRGDFWDLLAKPPSSPPIRSGRPSPGRAGSDSAAACASARARSRSGCSLSACAPP